MPKQITKAQLDEYLRSIGERKTAYQMALAGPPGNAVLSDLSRFCRAAASTWSEDARHHARLEGRREVWLRIREQLDLTEEELLVLLLNDSYTVIDEPEDESNG